MEKICNAIKSKNVWFVLVDAVVFAAAFIWFREEYLRWDRLVLVVLLAVVLGVCFAAASTMVYALTHEKKLPHIFIGSMAFFEAALWGMLTLINVDGHYNRRAIGIAGCILIAIFGVLCVLLLIRSAGKPEKQTRAWLAIALSVLFVAGSFFSLYPYPQELIPLIDTFLHGGEKAYFTYWSEDQAFSLNYAQEIKKAADKDFVILNLTDIQLNNNEALGEEGELVKNITDRLVNETQPDLITLTGDNAWGDKAYIELIKMLDSYGIPWAPVMGNHDGQGCPSEFWCAYKLLHAKNCIFRLGPPDMGYGNYIINIMQDGEVIHTLFMMDTHSEIEEDNINGEAGSGYDHLWENQLDWYAWAVDGISEAAGKTVESTVFFHIPLFEYEAAWQTATGVTDWETDSDAPFIGTYSETSFGVRHENGGWPPQSNGFFDLIKRKGSTKNVICGHDHVCDSSILYQGVRLTYALKDGPGCYWEPELNGGTVITVHANGSATVEHRFIDPYEDH